MHLERERDVMGKRPVTLADGRSTSKPMRPAPGAGQPAVQGSTVTHQEPEPTEMCPPQLGDTMAELGLNSAPYRGTALPTDPYGLGGLPLGSPV